MRRAAARSNFQLMLGYGTGELVGRAFDELAFQDEASEEPDSGQELCGELAAGECDHYRTEKRFVKMVAPCGAASPFH